MKKITFVGLFIAIIVATIADGLQAGQQVRADRDSDSSKTNGFSFDGGTFFMFMDAVKQECGLDLQKYGEIERSSENLHVPKMRLQSKEFTRVAELFNYISEAGGGYLGKWVVRTSGSEDIPDVIVFLPPRDEAARFAVRAFALKGIPQDRQALVELIRQEGDFLLTQSLKGEGPSRVDVSGVIHLANNGQILVASGGTVYLQLVEELVNAFRQKTAAGEPEKQGGNK